MAEEGVQRVAYDGARAALDGLATSRQRSALGKRYHYSRSVARSLDTNPCCTRHKSQACHSSGKARACGRVWRSRLGGSSSFGLTDASVAKKANKGDRQRLIDGNIYRKLYPTSPKNALSRLSESHGAKRATTTARTFPLPAQSGLHPSRSVHGRVREWGAGGEVVVRNSRRITPPPSSR
jgi:hypothetical protein